MISVLNFSAFVSQSMMGSEESIVASEYFCVFFPVWLLRYEAAGLDTPAAAAAGVLSSCCQAFLKRSILSLENWGTSVVQNAPLFLKSMPFVWEKKNV